MLNNYCRACGQQQEQANDYEYGKSRTISITELAVQISEIREQLSTTTTTAHAMQERLDKIEATEPIEIQRIQQQVLTSLTHRIIELEQLMTRVRGALQNGGLMRKPSVLALQRLGKKNPKGVTS